MNKNSKITALLTYAEVCQTLGTRAREARRFKKLSRSELSEKSGVSVPTIGRFETKGVATIGVLVKLATALGMLESLDGIFAAPKYRSMKEFIEQES